MSAVDCSALAGFAFFFFWKFHFTITRFFCVLSIAFQSVETFLGLFEDSGIKKKKNKGMLCVVCLENVSNLRLTLLQIHA
jgi:hypothetical protein